MGHEQDAALSSDERQAKKLKVQTATEISTMILNKKNNSDSAVWFTLMKSKDMTNKAGIA